MQTQMEGAQEHAFTLHADPDRRDTTACLQIRIRCRDWLQQVTFHSSCAPFRPSAQSHKHEVRQPVDPQAWDGLQTDATYQVSSDSLLL